MYKFIRLFLLIELKKTIINGEGQKQCSRTASRRVRTESHETKDRSLPDERDQEQVGNHRTRHGQPLLEGQVRRISEEATDDRGEASRRHPGINVQIAEHYKYTQVILQKERFSPSK